jgi:predicted GNAT family acetyltransferase
MICLPLTGLLMSFATVIRDGAHFSGLLFFAHEISSFCPHPKLRWVHVRAVTETSTFPLCSYWDEYMTILQLLRRVHVHCAVTETSTCPLCSYWDEFMSIVQLLRRVHVHCAVTETSTSPLCSYWDEYMSIVQLLRRVHVHCAVTETSTCPLCSYWDEYMSIVQLLRWVHVHCKVTEMSTYTVTVNTSVMKLGMMLNSDRVEYCSRNYRVKFF